MPDRNLWRRRNPRITRTVQPPADVPWSEHVNRRVEVVDVKRLSLEALVGARGTVRFDPVECCCWLALDDGRSFDAQAVCVEVIP
jgi:hypothetical protein